MQSRGAKRDLIVELANRSHRNFVPSGFYFSETVCSILKCLHCDFQQQTKAKQKQDRSMFCKYIQTTFFQNNLIDDKAEARDTPIRNTRLLAVFGC